MHSAYVVIFVGCDCETSIHNILFIGCRVEYEVVSYFDDADSDGFLPYSERDFLFGTLSFAILDRVDRFLRSYEGSYSSGATGVNEVTIVIKDIEVNKDDVD